MNVAAIQRRLACHGFDPGPADGDAGRRTVAALAAFQRSRGLVPDGIAGPLTRAALAAPAAIPPEPPWLALARAELGTAEAPGEADAPRVLAYFRDAGFPGIRHDAVAWCAAFVVAMLARAGCSGSGSLAARSYEGWGVALPGPRLGAVGVKRRGASPGGTKGAAAWQGHVGFVVAASARAIVLLGGNQGDAVSVASFPRGAFTAFRWPAGLALPPDRPPPIRAAGASSRSAASEA